MKFLSLKMTLIFAYLLFSQILFASPYARKSNFSEQSLGIREYSAEVIAPVILIRPEVGAGVGVTGTIDSTHLSPQAKQWQWGNVGGKLSIAGGSPRFGWIDGNFSGIPLYLYAFEAEDYAKYRASGDDRARLDNPYLSHLRVQLTADIGPTHFLVFGQGAETAHHSQLHYLNLSPGRLRVRASYAHFNDNAEKGSQGAEGGTIEGALHVAPASLGFAGDADATHANIGTTIGASLQGFYLWEGKHRAGGKISGDYYGPWRKSVFDVSSAGRFEAKAQYGYLLKKTTPRFGETNEYFLVVGPAVSIDRWNAYYQQRPDVIWNNSRDVGQRITFMVHVGLNAQRIRNPDPQRKEKPRLQNAAREDQIEVQNNARAVTKTVEKCFQQSLLSQNEAQQESIKKTCTQKINKELIRTTDPDQIGSDALIKSYEAKTAHQPWMFDALMSHPTIIENINSYQVRQIAQSALNRGDYATIEQLQKYTDQCTWQQLIEDKIRQSCSPRASEKSALQLPVGRYSNHDISVLVKAIEYVHEKHSDDVVDQKLLFEAAQCRGAARLVHTLFKSLQLLDSNQRLEQDGYTPLLLSSYACDVPAVMLFIQNYGGNPKLKLSNTEVDSWTLARQREMGSYTGEATEIEKYRQDCQRTREAIKRLSMAQPDEL